MKDKDAIWKPKIKVNTRPGDFQKQISLILSLAWQLNRLVYNSRLSSSLAKKLLEKFCICAFTFYNHQVFSRYKNCTLIIKDLQDLEMYNIKSESAL